MKNKHFVLAVFSAFFAVFSSCDNRKPAQQFTNEAVIYCDQDFKYIMELQREVYLADAKNEQIDIQYMSGEEVLKNLLSGKVQVAIIGRSLTDDEMIKIRRVDSSSVRELAIAKDAVAMVVGKNSTLKSLDYNTFLSAIKTAKMPYNLVFDNKQSGVVRSFDFLKNANAKSLFALDSIDAVIDYVNTHDNAIGFLPYAKFSDENNPEMKVLLEKIKLLPLKIKDSKGQEISITASQSEIALNDYPLIRPINYIIAKPHEDVSRNFIDFLYKQRGAKVFLKAGLIPTVMPGRDFVINSDGINVKKE